jgi:hypothetical protein
MRFLVRAFAIRDIAKFVALHMGTTTEIDDEADSRRLSNGTQSGPRIGIQ